MRLVAITGNPGSGKSAILKIFQEENIPTHSADEAVRDFYKKYPEQLISIFGVSSRVQILEKVRRQPELWSRLEALIHPFVKEHRRLFLLSHKTSPLVTCEVPLLFECALEKEFDFVILADAPLQIRRRRFPGKFFSLMEDRFSSQQDKAEKADAVLETNKPEEATRKEVLALIQKLCSCIPEL